jgi:putative membrane protein
LIDLCGNADQSVIHHDQTIPKGSELTEIVCAQDLQLASILRDGGTPIADRSPLASPIAGRFEVRTTASDHFSWLRTRASLERTLLSWICTAVSLIGFGFTIVHFFERMQKLPGVNPALHSAGPRYLGLASIACGILAFVVAIGQYNWTIRSLWSRNFALITGMKKEGIQTPLYAVVFVLILIGMFASGAVLLRFV